MSKRPFSFLTSTEILFNIYYDPYLLAMPSLTPSFKDHPPTPLESFLPLPRCITKLVHHSEPVN